MSTLTKENKISILQTLLSTVLIDHPEYCEDSTTGWELVENTKIWLEELKNEEYNFTAFGFNCNDVIDYAAENMLNDNNDPLILSADDAIEVLNWMLDEADVSIGIDWQTIENGIESFLKHGKNAIRFNEFKNS